MQLFARASGVGVEKQYGRYVKRRSTPCVVCQCRMSACRPSGGMLNTTPFGLYVFGKDITARSRPGNGISPAEKRNRSMNREKLRPASIERPMETVVHAEDSVWGCRLCGWSSVDFAHAPRQMTEDEKLDSWGGKSRLREIPLVTYVRACGGFPFRGLRLALGHFAPQWW